MHNQEKYKQLISNNDVYQVEKVNPELIDMPLTYGAQLIKY